MVTSFVLPYLIGIFEKIFPEIAKISDIIDGFYIYYPRGFVSSFVIGWYFNTVEIKKKKILFVAGACTLAVTIFGENITFMAILQ